LSKYYLHTILYLQLLKYDRYCKSFTECVQPKAHFPMRKYAKLLTESERLQDELEPISE